jgi:hypothetical protein
MSTRQELLAVINQLSDERLSSLLELAYSIQATSTAINRRAFLRLPSQERDRILAEQSERIADEFCSGSESIEWAEQYVECENWDDEE